MLGQVCEYRRDQHRVIQHRLLNWIKRQVPRGSLRDSLFLYRHNELGTFVIASWSQTGRKFQDILNLGTSLYNFTWEVAEQFRRSIRNTSTRRELLDYLQQREIDYLKKLQEHNDKEVDWRRFTANETNKTRITMTGTNYGNVRS